VIKSFACKETERIWKGEVSLRLPRDIQEAARRKLRMINNALSLQDLRVPPANRLESLKGDLEDRKSIRINDQWRICFTWQEGNAYRIEIIDYH
jgi:proteic killer suppression protein